MTERPLLRLGRFSITRDILENHQDVARLAFRDVIVVHAQMEDYFNSITYVGIHPDFEEVKHGWEAPRYSPRFVQVRQSEADDAPTVVQFAGWEKI